MGALLKTLEGAQSNKWVVLVHDQLHVIKHLHNTVKCVFILRKENMKLCTIILHLLPANPCSKVTLQIHRSNWAAVTSLKDKFMPES